MTSSSAPRLPIANGAQTFAAVRRLLARHPVLLLATILILLAEAAAGLVAPWALGRVVDLVNSGTSDTEIWRLGAAILIAAAVSATAGGIGIVLTARIFETGLADLRERFVAAALALPQRDIERAGTGELVSRASDDIAEVSDAIPTIVPAFTGALFTIAVSLVGISVIDARLALALVITLPVRWYLRTAPGVYAAERAAVAERAHHLLASLRGLESVLAFRLSDRHGVRIAAASWDVVRWTLRARIVQNMFFARLNLAEYLGISALLVMAFLLVGSGSVTVGAATTAVLIFLRLFGPIGQLLFVLDDAQSAAASLARVVGITGDARSTDDAPTAVTGAEDPGHGAQDPGSAPGHAVAVLEDVDFSYDTVSSSARPPVLHQVSLSIAPGEHVALVGASGAGKSTIATLLAGFHAPTAGTVHRHARTSLLAQETHVFAATAAENLRFGSPSASDAELREALRTVEADSFLAALPNGLDTMLGHGGHPLTAAQAQQLALARLVLADPVFAILDEATAEADSADADLLDRASAAAIRNRAALVIAHRLSQAVACDRILVVADGRIVENGAHEQLITDGGVYATLWSAWSEGRHEH